jgi:hypothetical protein
MATREIESITPQGIDLWLVRYWYASATVPRVLTSVTVRGIDELAAYKMFQRILS